VARAIFIDDKSFSWTLNELKRRFPDVSQKVLKAGADIVADQMKINLRGILSPEATGELVDAFGISPMQQDKNMDFNVHLGFDGYQTVQYKSYVRQVPFQLIARSFESGAVIGGRYEYSISKTGKKFKLKKKPQNTFEYWREKTPFAAPAVKKTREQAERAMISAAESEYQKLISESNNHK
jgi:hypothetical protein